MLARIEPNKKEAQDPSKCFFRLIKQSKVCVFFCPILRKAPPLFIRVLEIVLWRFCNVALWLCISNSSLNFKIIYNKFVTLFEDSSTFPSVKNEEVKFLT